MIKIPDNLNRNLHFLGLAMVVAGLPLSKPVISIGIMVLTGNWLLSGNLKQKIQLFWKNKAAVALSSIYVMHLVGLLFTSDYDFALHDLRTKIPLLVLPLVISSSPALNKERFSWLMSVFVAAVLISTFVSTYVFLGFKEVDGKDIRDISLFGSHIRFGLLICTAIFALLHFLWQTNQPLQSRLLQLGVVLWLGLFILILESMTAIVILMVTSYLLLIVFSWRQKLVWVRMSLLPVLVILPMLVAGALYLQIAEFYDVEPIDYAKLETHTPDGEIYRHFRERTTLENGHYVWIHVAWEKLEYNWEQRSELKFWGPDKKEQPLHATLIRFLASKGLRKDANGVAALSEKEVTAVENGIANERFIGSWSISNRIYQIIWEVDSYLKGHNPQGNSVTQRFEFAKAAIGIFKDNWLVGVGTGDHKVAYAEQYEKMNSQLSEKYRLRAHNQYLTIAALFGVLGFAWFIWALIFAPLYARKTRDFLFLTFYVIVLLSMINEDTLETQVGVTLVAFFNCLFLFGREEDYLRSGEQQHPGPRLQRSSDQTSNAA